MQFKDTPSDIDRALCWLKDVDHFNRLNDLGLTIENMVLAANNIWENKQENSKICQWLKKRHRDENGY